MMSLSEALFGDNPTGWRLPSRLCGALTLPAVFLIGFLLTGTLVGPTLGAVALLFDGLFITLSRAALWDTPYVCFGMYAVLVSLWSATRPSQRLKPFHIVASGVLAGLSLSSKWSGIFFLTPLALIHLASGNSPRLARKACDVAIVLFISFCIYILVTCVLRHLSVQELFAQTVEMYENHVNFTQPHRYASSAWGWPILARPIWFGYMPLPDLAPDGTPLARGTICLGNPIVFLFTGVSMAGLVACALRDALNRRLRLMLTLPVCGYLACWIPWLLLSVRKGFLYYFYPSLAFACIGLGVSCAALYKRNTQGRLICALLSVLMFAAFIAYLPVYMGTPISTTQMKGLIALDRWW